MLSQTVRAAVVRALLCAFTMPGATSAALPFHSGGVGDCSECHVVHSSGARAFLLRGADASSTCLRCHDRTAGAAGGWDTLVSTSSAGQNDSAGVRLPEGRSPGGDFGWLKVEYTWSENGAAKVEAGRTHGHDIVARDFAYGTGETSQAERYPPLGCTSCHDPHGRSVLQSSVADAAAGRAISSGSYAIDPVPTAAEPVGVYRMLWTPASKGPPAHVRFAATAYAMALPPPAGQTDRFTPAVTYGSGWNGWCGSCHDEALAPMKHFLHPLDVVLDDDVAQALDVRRTDATWAVDSHDLDLLRARVTDSAARQRPERYDRVTCLSCHRAHASEFPRALRAAPRGASAGTRAREVPTGDPLSRPDGARRSLCSGCHPGSGTGGPAASGRAIVAHGASRERSGP